MATKQIIQLASDTPGSGDWFVFDRDSDSTTLKCTKADLGGGGGDVTLSGSNSFTTGPQYILLDDDANAGWIVRRFSSTPTANGYQVEDESGNLLSALNQLGGLRLTESTGNTLLIRDAADTADLLYFNSARALGSLNTWQIGNGFFSGVGMADFASTGPYCTFDATTFTIHLRGIGQTALTVNALSGQTGPLFTFAGDGGTSDILAHGEFAPAHLADSAASNDSVYFSTTATKLVYKDSGGTVHALY